MFISFQQKKTKEKKKAKALTDDEVMNILWNYSNWLDVWEVRPDLNEILERHGHDKYYM